MAPAQLVGAFAGAQRVLARGERVVRVAVLLVVLTLVGKLGLDTRKPDPEANPAPAATR